MPGNRLTLQIVGADEDNGNVRFDELIRQLDAFKDALYKTEEALGSEVSVYYRVIDLRHDSPATLVLEAVAPVSTPQFEVAENAFVESVVGTFYETITSLQEDRPIPRVLEAEGLDSFARLSLKDAHILSVRVSRNGSTLEIKPSIRPRVIAAKAEMRYVYQHGSVTGLLQHSNTHGAQAIFTVYPTDRQPRVRCIVPRSLTTQFYRAGDRYVTVYGRLRYREGEKWPIDMHADRLEIHPEENDLPTFDSFKGTSPDTLSGQSSEGYVREIRNEWG